jgi:hypothetical protein
MKTRIFTLFASASGYLYAAAAILVVVFGFMTISTWSHKLAQEPFMRVHPRYSGGAVARSFSAGGAFWEVHKPVFDGLVGERHEGFAQIGVELTAPGSAASAPIDCDGDGTADFILSLPAGDGAPEISSPAPFVKGLGAWSREGESAIVRVKLENPGASGK